MGYKDRTVELKFDGSNDELENLGEGCFVRIKNPKLLPLSKLMPEDVETDATGVPVDKDAPLNAVYDRIASVILDWRVWDPDDDSDTPTVLPLPPTAEIVAKLPASISEAIAAQLKDAVPSL